MQMPEDANMLLSYVNLKLRDHYPDLDALCEDLDVSKRDIEEKLGRIGCTYDSENNRFR